MLQFVNNKVIPMWYRIPVLDEYPSLYLDLWYNWCKTSVSFMKNKLYLSHSHRQHVISDSSSNWAALTVHGFADSLLSWGKEEHGYSFNCGDNIYTFVVFPEDRGRYWYISAVGACDIISWQYRTLLVHISCWSLRYNFMTSRDAIGTYQLLELAI